VARPERLGVGPGDLVAVALPPGPGWLPLVREIWESGAALLPLDHRLTSHETKGVLDRALPAVVIDAAGPMRIAEGLPVDPSIGACVATSGTAGTPKVAELPRSALEVAVRASIDVLGGREDDPWLCCLPIAHVGGLLVVLRGVIGGAPVEIVPRFDVDVVAESPHVFTSVVPTMLHRLLEAGADLAHFRAILVGGADLGDDQAARARERGAPVVTTYGLTETCGGVVYDGVPFEDTAIRFGGEHEVQLAGPTVMEGYRSDPSATAAAFTLDGWLRTGDAGSLDDDGRLRIQGRLDEVISSGAERIWPQEVEAALREHPRVLDVAVAGRPDEEWGARVVAYVVPDPDRAPPTTQELRDFASDRIARFKAPRDVVLVEELPRTASGKVRRGELARLG
jgi:O-succinylbenzoic acid--CoA ligase